MAAAGADVAITGTGRDPSTFPADEKAVGWRDIHSTAEQIEAHRQRALPLVGDVSNASDVANMIQQTLDTFGRIDILINNAAVTRGVDRVAVVDLSEELFRRVIDVKLVGAFLFSKALIPILLEQNQGGWIINISSTAGKVGEANASAYCAANFGLQGFTQALAQELAPHRISVNAICPGWVDTSRIDIVKHDEQWDQLLQDVPMKRVATDDEVAGLATYLCSPIAEYITGQSINTDF